MNSSITESSNIFVNNSTIIIVESWFIPLDILSIICTTLVIGLVLLFLLLIIVDKTCRTVPMMLVANSCLAKLIWSINLLSASIFSINNDIKKIESEDSLCIFRCYMGYALYAIMNYSYLLQSIYRYNIVIYPTRLYLQSRQIQILFICITWIIGLSYPIVFIFTHEISYDHNNQICQPPFRLSFSLIFSANCIYIIPISCIMFIYFKLVQYVHRINKRVTSTNVVLRAQRQLKMIRRTIILVMILFTTGFPNALFIFMAIFNSEPKYNQRINVIFIGILLTFVTVTLLQFTDPLKTSLMKRIKRRPNTVVAIVR